jgi:Subtilase family/FlgD Ig-like domain
MIRFPSLFCPILLICTSILLAGSAVAQDQPKVRIHPDKGSPLNIKATHKRATFRTTGDSKRGQDPFQDVDFTLQTKKATGENQTPTSPMDPQTRALVKALGDPYYLRSLEKRKSAQAPSGRVPVLGSPRGEKLTPDKDLPWTEDALLGNPTDMNDEYVSLAENPLTGNLYAVFAAKDLGGTDRDIHIARSTDQGASWTVTEMPAFSQDEYHPEIAIDAAGYIHVVWIRDDGWILRARTSSTDDVSDWIWVKGLSTEETLATPSIAVSGGGDFATVFIAAGWLTVNYDLYQYEWTLIFMYSTNGGQTVTYDYFLPDGYQDLWPDVAMHSGLVHFVNAEVDYETGETEILMASDTYNGGFSEPGLFTGYTSNNTGFPQITCQDENVYVVFQEDYADGMTADGDIIYIYSWDSGETFFGPFGLVADEYESVGPSIFTRDGVVGVLWLDAPANADEFWLAGRLGSGYGHTDFFGEVELVSDQPRVEPMFHSCFGTAAMNRVHAAWIDRRDYQTQGHNVYNSSREVAANLAPFTPAGWDSCLVTNMVRGDRSQGFLAAGDTTFVSFAFLNNGLAPIEGGFLLDLKLDGILVGQWSLDNGLGTGTFVPLEDYPLIVSAGSHSLSFTLDTLGQVNETSESDNQHSQTFTWVEGDPALRLNPDHLTKTIVPELSRSEALQMAHNPILKNEVHLPVIETRLSEAMDNTRKDELLRVMIVPATRLNPGAMSEALKGATRATRREVITTAAKNHLQKTYDRLQPELNLLAMTGQGNKPDLLWLPGLIAMKMTADAVEKLSGHPEVGHLWLDDQKSQTFGGAPTRIIPADEKSSSGNKANAWHIGMIGADQAWASGLTGAGILVGHLDTGIAYDHPDLAGQMWDGGASYPNHGWDSVDGDDNPYDGDVDWFHGTHTAGLIAGDGTGGIATGAAPEATLMALRAMPGYMADMIEGLQFGLDNGVHLFSLSGGWAQGSDTVRSTNRYNAELLLSIDVPWVCAAGNGDNVGGHYAVPTDIASPGDCPGPFHHPNGGPTSVFTVGASWSDNTMWAYSSYGPTQWDMENPNGDTDYHDYPWTPGLMKPDITAPGGDITSCTGSNGYVSYSGTSMATPLVAATICLIWSADPALLVTQVGELLETTATDLTQSPCSSGRDNYSGAGLVNIPAALTQIPTAEPEPFWICNDGDLPLIITGTSWNAQWLQINTPTGAIAPGDSVQAMALMDPEGLPESQYHDTVIFTSNAPGSPHALPVTLSYGNGISSVTDGIPASQGAGLSNHPNPFNPRTVLKFNTRQQAMVSLDIYDLRGRLVRNLVHEVLPSGEYEFLWNGLDDTGLAVSSGQYFARLREEGRSALTRKLMLVR